MATAAPEVVFHLAAEVSGKCEPELVVPMIETNLVGTAQLLNTLAHRGCRRVVLAGSGDVPTSGEPASPYAVTKAGARHLARLYAHQWHVPVVEARMFLVYGPGQARDKVIPYAIDCLLRGASPRLGECRRRVDAVFINDVVEGLVRAAVVSGIDGEVIDLGSGRGSELREIMERIVSLVGANLRPSYGAVPDRPEEPEEVASWEGALRLLGWRARTWLEDGLAATVDWYRERLHG